MTGRTHLAAALVLTSVVMDKCSSEVLLGAIVGGLIPDIDTPRSLVCDMIPGIDNIWHRLRNLFLTMKINSQKSWKINNLEILKPLLKCKAQIFSFLYNLVKHRGALTHSAITLMILIIFNYKYNNDFLLSIFLGVISHHLLDLLTDQGLNYFYPLLNKYLGIKLVTTGSIFESILYYFIVLLGIAANLI